MNRPGQPLQRPPSLAPPAGLSSQFRSPYPTSQYPLPQRSYPAPTLQQQNAHRTPAIAPGSNVTSYATQAGQSGSGAASAVAQSRDFGPDDFPALGSQAGQQPLSGQNSSQSQNPPPGADLSAPPGVPPPGVSPHVSNGTHHLHPHQHNAHQQLHNPQPTHNPLVQAHHHPQTPAQQVLMSAADRWGLLGLLAMIKNAGVDADGGLSSVGTDLGAMGLDMGYEGNLYSTFVTPWADQSAAHSVEPDFHLPPCYSAQPPALGPAKAGAFSDETLFFMFYSSPRDALQEIAAQELWNRNWRYHKDLRIWITKESGSAPSSKIPGGEAGTYTWWNPDDWCKERKEMSVRYADLEEKTVPAFVMGPGLVLAQAVQTIPGQQQVQGAAGQPGGAQSAGQARMQMAGI
ncbi:hypothetical protein EV702DRAFT_1171999 [Suillus placidus]|uniref:NOT2/NOT3/NOT5 C-terminal domain-containing protein n=1 Tax=Suillus placidus TaxID=48579 RepID=A0A9P6ZGQ7_9AGAM|nr:hypothetical protein EV702DRAFT_1171999 [Suillus placidus]